MLVFVVKFYFDHLEMFLIMILQLNNLTIANRSFLSSHLLRSVNVLESDLVVIGFDHLVIEVELSWVQLGNSGTRRDSGAGLAIDRGDLLVAASTL